MNTGQLEYLVETVRCGSFRKAAAELYLTPQAVAKAVKELERELGAALFQHGTGGASPSPLALEIAERAEGVLETFDDFKSYARELSAATHVRIAAERQIVLAATTFVNRGCIIGPHALDAFHDENPLLRIEAHALPNETCVTALLAHAVDAAIMLGRPAAPRPHFAFVHLGTLPVFVACRVDGPLAAQDSVRLADLKGRRLASPLDFLCSYPTIKRQLEAAGAFNGFSHLPFSLEPLASFIEEGGLALVTAHSSLPDAAKCAVLRPIDAADILPLHVWFAYRTSEDSAPFAAVASYLRRSLFQPSAR